ncbi:uncharacterized protein LOC116255767 [Nymphaea colorata]|nr:uncharacterized protein LOC116255767 [Nymphaea colorata]
MPEMASWAWRKSPGTTLERSLPPFCRRTLLFAAGLANCLSPCFVPFHLSLDVVKLKEKESTRIKLKLLNFKNSHQKTLRPPLPLVSSLAVTVTSSVAAALSLAVTALSLWQQHSLHIAA